MAKEEREIRDVYWVCLKERNERGVRKTLEKYVFEGAGGAYKKYEELIFKYEPTRDKMLIVDIVFIKDGYFNTVREKHLWTMEECGNN